jgi:outer membrane protein with beta-barrel domain
MRRPAFFLALACGISALALPAFAQDRTGTWEISPFAGGYFGGRLYGNYTVPFAPGTVTTVQFLEPDNDLAYGARLAYNFTRHVGAEFDWTSSTADLHAPDLHGASPRHPQVGTLRQNVYEGNALFNFGNRHALGYVGFGAGIADLKRNVPGIESSTTRFTGSFSAGGKFFFTPRVGLRVDGRYRVIDLRSDDDFSCHDHDGCHNHGAWSYNGELTGGLIFAF